MWRDIELRARLIKEELNEFRDASSLYINDKHIIEVADALGDLLYVVYGAGVTYGIDLEPVFQEIHRSNMSKLWPDGKAHRDTGGKVIKSPNYSPANLAFVLEQNKGGSDSVSLATDDGKAGNVVNVKEEEEKEKEPEVGTA